MHKNSTIDDKSIVHDIDGVKNVTDTVLPIWEWLSSKCGLRTFARWIDLCVSNWRKASVVYLAWTGEAIKMVLNCNISFGLLAEMALPRIGCFSENLVLK